MHTSKVYPKAMCTKCSVFFSDMTSAKEQPPLRKECRETIVFEKSIDQMNSDERRSKLSEIVTNGRYDIFPVKSSSRLYCS